MQNIRFQATWMSSCGGSVMGNVPAQPGTIYSETLQCNTLCDESLTTALCKEQRMTQFTCPVIYTPVCTVFIFHALLTSNSEDWDSKWPASARHADYTQWPRWPCRPRPLDPARNKRGVVLSTWSLKFSAQLFCRWSRWRVGDLYLLGDLSGLQVSPRLALAWGRRKFHGHCSFTYDVCRNLVSFQVPRSVCTWCVHMYNCMCVSLTSDLPPVRSCRQGYVYVCLPDRRPATCAVL